MAAGIHEITFNGELLERGFWLYVWEITTPRKTTLYYVGRTGDSSSSNAQSPFNRMGQHLSFNKRCNVLRRRLTALGIDPESCAFLLLAYGPILPEAARPGEHREKRDQMAAMERALAELMTTAGYKVMNTVNSRSPLDTKAFTLVQAAFADHFKRLTGIA